MLATRFYPYPRLALVLAGIVLLLIHFVVGIPYQFQIVFFLASILVAGIPHGSLDHLVYRRNVELSGNLFSRVLFLGFYHKYLILYGVLWFMQPGLASLVFVFLSAYHFGEIDWIWLKGNNSRSHKLLAFLYGFVLLSSLFLFHLKEAQTVVDHMQFWFSLQPSWVEGLEQNRWTFLLAGNGVIIALLAYVIYQGRFAWWMLPAGIVQMLFLETMLIQLPIFLGFGFYFSLWHSLLTLLSLRTYVWGKGGSWLSCIKEGFGNSVLAILLIGVLLLVFRSSYDINQLVSLLFIGIAVLTAPHMVVISKMFEKFRTQTGFLF